MTSEPLATPPGPGTTPTPPPSTPTPDPAAAVVAWKRGDPAPDGFVVVPDNPDDPSPSGREHLQHAQLAPGAESAARVVATAELLCSVSGETIAVGEEYIDGGDVLDASGNTVRYIVKVGHEHEPLQLA